MACPICGRPDCICSKQKSEVANCITVILKYAEKNSVEINISPDGVGVWTQNVIDGPGINSKDISVDKIEESVNALNVLRKAGWENSQAT